MSYDKKKKFRTKEIENQPPLKYSNLNIIFTCNIILYMIISSFKYLLNYFWVQLILNIKNLLGFLMQVEEKIETETNEDLNLLVYMHKRTFFTCMGGRPWAFSPIVPVAFCPPPPTNEGVGVGFWRSFFRGVPSKISELIKTSRCSINQARINATRIIVFIDDLLFMVGWKLFFHILRDNDSIVMGAWINFWLHCI